jgi:hypothetical protein
MQRGAEHAEKDGLAVRAMVRGTACNARLAAAAAGHISILSQCALRTSAHSALNKPAPTAPAAPNQPDDHGVKCRRAAVMLPVADMPGDVAEHLPPARLY